MTHAASNRATGAAATPPGDGADLFAALVQALADQLDAARHGRLDRVIESMERADALIEQARAAGHPASPACRRKLQRLHDQVRLCLAQQHDELGRRRKQLARGKGTLRTYREAGGAG